MTHPHRLNHSVLTGLHHFHPPSVLVVGFVVVIIVGAALCRATRLIRHGLRIVVFGAVIAGILWYWPGAPGHLWIHHQVQHQMVLHSLQQGVHGVIQWTHRFFVHHRATLIKSLTSIRAGKPK